MSYTDEHGPMMTVDGKPLKRSLAIALKAAKNTGAAPDISATYICFNYFSFSYSIYAFPLG